MGDTENSSQALHQTSSTPSAATIHWVASPFGGGDAPLVPTPLPIVASVPLHDSIHYPVWNVACLRTSK
jgi:hypothetical protein